jgi:hypothetical protein
VSDRFTRRVYESLIDGRDLTLDESSHVDGCEVCQSAAARARAFEQELYAELADLRAPLPGDPRSSREDRTSQTRTSSFIITLVGFALIVVVVTASIAGAGLLLVGEGPAASSTPSVVPAPSSLPPSSPASLRPTTSPATPSPSPSPEPVRAGAWFETGSAMLPIFDTPDGTPFAEIQAGSHMYVVDAQEAWYLVQALDTATFEYVFGWIPATHLEGREAVVLLPCVPADETSPAHLGGLHPQRQLECGGAGQSIRVEGYAVGGQASDSAYAGDPAWLAAPPLIALSGAIGAGVTTGQIGLHLPPDRDFDIPMSDREGTDGVRLAVTGHFADSRAGSCDLTAVREGYPSLDDELETMWCEQRFVVDEVEIIQDP